MFFKKPGPANNFKKTIYLIATTILGLLLSFLAHALIEIKYLSWAEKQGIVVTFYNSCALAPWLQITLWTFGALGGFFLGLWWWHVIYVARLWEKKTK